jgi:hypothetical protein
MSHSAQSAERRSRVLGVWALVAGLLSAFGSATIYASSVWLDPPNWVRLVTMPLFPIGMIAVVPLGSMAVRGPGKRLAIAGWLATLAGFALFIYAIVSLS